MILFLVFLISPDRVLTYKKNPKEKYSEIKKFWLQTLTYFFQKDYTLPKKCFKMIQNDPKSMKINKNQWKSTKTNENQQKINENQWKNGWHIDSKSPEGVGHRPCPLILSGNHPQSTLHYPKRPGGNQCAWGAPNRQWYNLSFLNSFLTIF